MEDWKSKLAALGGTLPQGDADTAPESAPAAPDIQKEPLHIIMERKGRAGKTATIIEGFTCDDTEVAEVARKLRAHLGTGGSSRGGEILLQGDRREGAAAMLRSLGYRVKPC
ncbi:MAG: translation initiation factor [Muribaculaceae bacterium]|nr:translation initiation factor [Muribaculaceae bacterium]